MSRIRQTFQQAAQQSRMTFMPFVTAGDPSIDTTRRVLQSLSEAGADLIELGFPYSDPIADGPVIQASYTRALQRRVTVADIMQMMTSLKEKNLPPVLAMVSYAIIFRHGPETFATDAAAAGFSGLIVPDLPADEADEMNDIAAAHGLDLVQLIAPTTSPQRTTHILAASRGFIYCISVAGTTGVRNELPTELMDQLRMLRSRTDLPLAVGFGISGPDQVEMLAGVADGVIVGSAIVRQISESENADDAAAKVADFTRRMRAAVDAARPSTAPAAD
jgi:tryptophan synthase alpha chain